MSKFIIFSLTLLGLSTQNLWAQTYKYSDLMLKNYDEMSEEVQTRVQKAKEISSQDAESSDSTDSDREAVEALRDGLLLIFSRPDKDNMLGKILPDLRRELSNYRAYEDTLASILSEALAGVANSKLGVSTRSTYLFVLENLMGEMRSQIKDKPEYRQAFEQIRDAKIKLDKDVIRDRKLRSMFKTESPSKQAEEILKKNPPPPITQKKVQKEAKETPTADESEDLEEND